MPSTCVISFDFELGWGVIQRGGWVDRERSGVYRRLRDILPRLWAFLGESEMPTTWAVVSAMLLESQDRLNMEHLPKEYRDEVHQFLKESEGETRCGRDLLEHMDRAGRYIEVASHTSTHLNSHVPGMTADIFRTDVADSMESLEGVFGKVPRSLIFPRDDSSFRTAVVDLPLSGFRLNPSLGRSEGPLMRAARGFGRFFREVQPSLITTGSGGRVFQTGSLYFNWVGGRYPSVKRNLLLRQTRRLLRQFGESEGVFHVWLHPFNLAESKELLELLLMFLKEVRTLRDQGRCEVLCMKTITERALNWIGPFRPAPSESWGLG